MRGRCSNFGDSDKLSSLWMGAATSCNFGAEEWACGSLGISEYITLACLVFLIAHCYTHRGVRCDLLAQERRSILGKYILGNPISFRR